MIENTIIDEIEPEVEQNEGEGNLSDNPQILENPEILNFEDAKLEENAEGDIEEIEEPHAEVRSITSQELEQNSEEKESAEGEETEPKTDLPFDSESTQTQDQSEIKKSIDEARQQEADIKTNLIEDHFVDKSEGNLIKDSEEFKQNDWIVVRKSETEEAKKEFENQTEEETIDTSQAPTDTNEPKHEDPESEME